MTERELFAAHDVPYDDLPEFWWAQVVSKRVVAAERTPDDSGRLTSEPNTAEVLV